MPQPIERKYQWEAHWELKERKREFDKDMGRLTTAARKVGALLNDDDAQDLGQQLDNLITINMIIAKTKDIPVIPAPACKQP